MQLQTFIASALLLSGLASAVNLPRANEAAECVKPGASCNVLMHRLCCADSVCVTLRARRGEDGVSVTIHVVFFLLLTQLWHIVLRWTLSHLILLIAPARKLSSTKQGQIICHNNYLFLFYFQILAFVCVCLMNYYGVILLSLQYFMTILYGFVATVLRIENVLTVECQVGP